MFSTLLTFIHFLFENIEITNLGSDSVFVLVIYITRRVNDH